MKTERIEIRRATEGDVPGMMALLEIANFHHIPSPEMPELDYRYYFVATDGERLVGLAGYKIVSPTEGKTQLMVVDPECRGLGLGLRLHTARVRAMAKQGVKTVITNADLPKTVGWYKKHFGYREIGTLKKVHEFGDPGIDSWTTLEMDIEGWQRRQSREDANGAV